MTTATVSHAAQTAQWTKKDLLGLRELSAEEIRLILQTAESFREISLRPIKKVPALRGKTVVNLFFEPSTRTRVSFELAAKRLSADIMNIAAQSSSLSKGETILDTVRNLEALKIDMLVIRHAAAGVPHLIAKHSHASVINAGDGSHEHPTQALLDLFTIQEKKGRVEGISVSIIGDIAHSRVARSNIWGLTKLGARVTVCGPATLVPPQIEQLGVRVTYKLEEAIRGADVVMLLRIQHERQEATLVPSLREYRLRYGIDRERLKQAKPDVLIMHPGPVNRGVELDSDVADGPFSVILDQVTNGLAVRMAVLYLLSGSRLEEEPA
ncbi:MAG: aspartate carbamoyltransferase [Candidatus Omnitrophica bacterium CG11_big_fil_rev_8_21_14_0_20_63_9]|nr:MAG: aspartate carbamoyltransferase [Candidatus Omnitrophica bacterium CG11_big_fil_rev_8_21_14_0_20_63_9]